MDKTMQSGMHKNPSFRPIVPLTDPNTKAFFDQFPDKVMEHYAPTAVITVNSKGKIKHQTDIDPHV
jgi:hypothetical protein